MASNSATRPTTGRRAPAATPRPTSPISPRLRVIPVHPSDRLRTIPASLHLAQGQVGHAVPIAPSSIRGGLLPHPAGYLLATAQVQLAQDVGDVAGHGVLAHPELLPDREVRHPQGDELGHLQLARRYLGTGWRNADRRGLRSDLRPGAAEGGGGSCDERGTVDAACDVERLFRVVCSSVVPSGEPSGVGQRQEGLGLSCGLGHGLVAPPRAHQEFFRVVPPALALRGESLGEGQRRLPSFKYPV